MKIYSTDILFKKHVEQYVLYYLLSLQMNDIDATKIAYEAMFNKTILNPYSSPEFKNLHKKLYDNLLEYYPIMKIIYETDYDSEFNDIVTSKCKYVKIKIPKSILIYINSDDYELNKIIILFYNAYIYKFNIYLCNNHNIKCPDDMLIHKIFPENKNILIEIYKNILNSYVNSTKVVSYLNDKIIIPPGYKYNTINSILKYQFCNKMILNLQFHIEELPNDDKLKHVCIKKNLSIPKKPILCYFRPDNNKNEVFEIDCETNKEKNGKPGIPISENMIHAGYRDKNNDYKKIYHIYPEETLFKNNNIKENYTNPNVSTTTTSTKNIIILIIIIVCIILICFLIIYFKKKIYSLKNKK